MKWSISAILFCITATGTSGFMSQQAQQAMTRGSDTFSSKNSIIASTTFISTRRNMASVDVDVDTENDTETSHDVVKVDLSDGRDYPIYIGAEFDDKKGKFHKSYVLYPIVLVYYFNANV